MYQNIYENYIRLLYILLNVNSRVKNALIMNTLVRIYIIAKLNFFDSNGINIKVTQLFKHKFLFFRTD